MQSAELKIIIGQIVEINKKIDAVVANKYSTEADIQRLQWDRRELTNNPIYRQYLANEIAVIK